MTPEELIISRLRIMPLWKYPADNIREELKKLGKVIAFKQMFHPGKMILRARLHSDDQEEFTKRSDLSFKPQKYNKTYQRASTPENTLFYGSTIPEEIQEKDLNNARVIGLQEAHPWLRDKTTCGVKKITWGRWHVKEDISLIGYIHHDKYYDKSSYTREIVDHYNKVLLEHPDLKERSILINEFLSGEFAKEQTENDYDYLISAIVSENVISQGFDGVFYPSVRVGGNGFNVAIKPNSVDEKLVLVAVGEGLVYKRRDHIVVDNIQQAYNADGLSSWEYEKVDDKYCRGEQVCLKEFGVTTMDEFLKSF